MSLSRLAAAGSSAVVKAVSEASVPGIRVLSARLRERSRFALAPGAVAVLQPGEQSTQERLDAGVAGLADLVPQPPGSRTRS